MNGKKHRSILIVLAVILAGKVVAQVNPGVPEPKICKADSGLINRIHPDIEAEFPGGEIAWKKFLEKNIHTDVPFFYNAPQGEYKAIISFYVDTSGFILEATPETKCGFGMEEEIIRVIKQSPRWWPQKENGKFAKAWRKQIIYFSVPVADP